VKAAVEVLQKAVGLRPDFAEAFFNLGNAFYHEGLLDTSIVNYRRAIELRADYADAHNNLGYVLKKKGRAEEAAREFRQAEELWKGQKRIAPYRMVQIPPST
jgi:Flp pilus assembly protein TadD